MYDDDNTIFTPIARNITIDPKVTAEYINFHDVVDVKELDEKQLEDIKTKLATKEITVDKTKELTFHLAHCSNPKAYKILQDLYFSSKDYLQSWTALALEECQMFVQIELSEKLGNYSSDDNAMVSSPGGGDGQRLQFWLMFVSKKNKELTKEKQKSLQKIFNKHFEKNNSVIQKIDWQNDYCILSALQAIDVAVDDIATPILEDSKDLLKFHYFVINTNYPTPKEILDYLDSIKKL